MAPSGLSFDYQGNGIYKTTVTTYQGTRCEGSGTPAEYQINVQARSSVGGVPPGGLITRPPGSVLPLTYSFYVEPNPGQSVGVLAVGQNVTAGADGKLTGKTVETNTLTDLATARFPTPGTYSLFAATQVGEARSPWSPPVTVKVKAPFDFTDIPVLESRSGHRRVITAQVRERAAIGQRVQIHIQRRGGNPPKKGPGIMGRPLGRWRSLGSAKVGKNRWFARPFKSITDNGYYELRFTMKSTDKIKGRSILGGGYIARPLRGKGRRRG